MRCPVPENSDQRRRQGVFQRSRQGAAASIFLIAAISLAAGAHAEGKDPTVPPAAWLAAQPVAPGTQAALPGGDTSSVRLVLVGKTRKLALIDGQVIKPGDMHNGAKVAAIGRNQVLMEEKEKSLKLAPGVQKKKPSRSVAPKKQPKRIIVGGTPAANEKQTGNRSSQ